MCIHMAWQQLVHMQISQYELLMSFPHRKYMSAMDRYGQQNALFVTLVGCAKGLEAPISMDSHGA